MFKPMTYKDDIDVTSIPDELWFMQVSREMIFIGGRWSFMVLPHVQCSPGTAQMPW
jgi:hypothetical protein